MPFFLWLLQTLRRAAWAPVVVFGLHEVSARLGFYRAWPPLDIPIHFLGGIAIALFFGQAYRAAEEMDLLGQPAEILYGVTVFALTCSSAVFWEFTEFLSDRYLGSHMQGGLEDTLGDMLVGIVGGLVFLGVSVLTRSAWQSPAAPPPP
ncbi:MAG TPA: hypothetical protein VKM72_06655 [Thermoanaerobaculia bacterium]|nr:hypothetical protein [Thermoanaerobaculia bacterium]